MHNGKTNRKAHVFSDKHKDVDVDTIVAFVIQRGQSSKGGSICGSLHVELAKHIKIKSTNPFIPFLVVATSFVYSDHVTIKLKHVNT